MKSCPYCYREITPEIEAEKAKRKADNARSSIQKARANGTPIGRPKKVNDTIVAKLRGTIHRGKRLSIRQIAKEHGVSSAAIQQSLKRQDLK